MRHSLMAKSLAVIGLMSVLTSYAEFAHAQSAVPAADLYISDAKRLYERLAGVKVPLDDVRIREIALSLSKGDNLEAARRATEHPSFLNLTVKQMALKLSTREEAINVPFNDFAASFLGVTRDRTDSRELLFGNFFYIADPALAPADKVRSNLVSDILSSNNHYSDLESKNYDLGAVLKRQPMQQIVYATNDKDKMIVEATVNSPDAAGVLTSRSFTSSHLSAGTNRRAVEYTFREFLCLRIEDWADTRASDLRIGRDIDRFPGGDHNKFATTCKGCHTGMDGFRGAFAKWDYTDMPKNIDALKGSPNRGYNADANGVAPKLNQNGTVFPNGYVTIDNSFVNNSNMGTNSSVIEWRGDNITKGNGVKEFGKLVSNTKRFSQCMSKRIFESVCRKTLDLTSQTELAKRYAEEFEKQNYRIKDMYEFISVQPECGLISQRGT
jgi:hypothetical protein